MPRTKWWNFADRNLQDKFASAARDRLTSSEGDGGQNWETVTKDLRQLGEEILGKTSGKRKTDKETWWWNEKVQRHIKKKERNQENLIYLSENNLVNKEAYKNAKKEAKRGVARAKEKLYHRLYEDMETVDGQKRALRIAKQKDIYQTKLIRTEKATCW